MTTKGKTKSKIIDGVIDKLANPETVWVNSRQGQYVNDKDGIRIINAHTGSINDLDLTIDGIKLLDGNIGFVESMFDFDRWKLASAFAHYRKRIRDNEAAKQEVHISKLAERFS